MGSIFASIAESDKPLQEEPNSPMICFLIHLASDLNIQGPFLSRLHRLPADVTQTDEFSSLSCASTWLQSSLVLIRDSYSPDSTPLDLQLPFVVLETEYQRARARATALQQQCPNEQVVTATLDLAVLKAAKLVTSAEHAFRMLRVPMESVDFSQRLLVWAEDGTNEGATQVLKDAIVAVIKSNEMGDRIEVNSLGGASEAIAEVTFRRPDQLEPGKQPRKKDSVVTRRNGSGGSSTGWLDLEDWSAADGNELQRYHTC